jgi:hypothetical protein
LDACFPDAKVMLDYAGGYGVFARLMRDEGYNFFRHDPYCENIFAKHFDKSDSGIATFDVLTAFEVFEHFNEPIPEMEKLFALSPNILFSTTLLPEKETEINDWWYLSTETGQHIAFYSTNTMKYIAKKYNKQYYFSDNNIHLFTSQPLHPDAVDYAFNNKTHKVRLFGLVKTPYSFKVEKNSLIENDYNHIKHLL